MNNASPKLAILDEGLTVIALQGGVDVGAVISEDKLSAGRHYWEVTAQCGPDSLGANIGVWGATEFSDRDFSQSGAVILDGGRFTDREVIAGYVAGGREDTLEGDVFQFALDVDEGGSLLLKMEFGPKAQILLMALVSSMISWHHFLLMPW